MTELEKSRFCSPHCKGHHRMLKTKGQRSVGEPDIHKVPNSPQKTITKAKKNNWK